MENLDGKFTLEIDGKQRELVCNIGVLEHLEKSVFKRPIHGVLKEIIYYIENIENPDDSGRSGFYISELVDTIHAGLLGNNDKRFSREAIGNEVLQNGSNNYLEFYISFLTYGVNGGETVQIDPVLSSDKKK